MRRRIGPYTLLDRLGCGAMGEVYRATDAKMFGRDVAVKILSERLSRDDHARARFRREVEVASRLIHPNVVAIHDRGESDGRPYFVMEFVDGLDLGRVVGDSGIDDPRRGLAIARQIGEALDFAHRNQVVHRDVKPSNILIVGEPGAERVKLVDFGIVHVDRSTLTGALTQPGTYSYMAPEQLRNECVDARSDLFAFGIVLYELFVGEHPFDAATEPLVAGRILSDDPVPPRRLRPGVSPGLESLILALLSKDASSRPASAAGVVATLDVVGRDLAAAGPGESTDPEIDDLDTLAQGVADDLAAWAARREREGKTTVALAALEKALVLFPGDEGRLRAAERLRERVALETERAQVIAEVREAIAEGDVVRARAGWTRAHALAPDDPAVQELEFRLLDGDAEGEGGCDARARRRVGEAERALDDGDSDVARRILEDVLARGPEDSLARFLLERCSQIERAGVDYRRYRRRLRESDDALDRGDFDGAVRACRAAARLWPDDAEWKAVDGRIAGRVDAEIATEIARAERALRDAERALADPEIAMTGVAEVRAAVSRARALGAPGAWTRPVVEEARRLEEDLAERRRVLAERERRRIDRSTRVRAEAMAHARRWCDRGRAAAAARPVRTEEALYAYETAREEVVRALHESPEDTDATSLGRECDEAIERLSAAVERERKRDAEVRERLRTVRGALGAVERLADGDRAAIERGLAKLSDAEDGLARLENLAADDAQVSEFRAQANEWRRTLTRRRDHENRRAGELRAALSAGLRALGNARGWAAGPPADIVRAARECSGAERWFARALTIQDDHAGAREAREEARSLREHLQAELLRLDPRSVAAAEKKARVGSTRALLDGRENRTVNRS